MLTSISPYSAMLLKLILKNSFETFYVFFFVPMPSLHCEIDIYGIVSSDLPQKHLLEIF